jgi:nucleotide-binding universal stress UspA family protein
MAIFTKVLVPLDGSDEAATALPVAAAVARRFGASVLLLEMVPAGDARLGLVADAASGAMTDPHVFEDVVEARQHVAEGYVSAVAEELSAQGLDVSFAIGTGSEGRGIVEAAHREGVDLIVMATHARGVLGRLVFGSTTDYVIRNAHIPVLVVPPAAEQDA